MRKRWTKRGVHRWLVRGGILAVATLGVGFVSVAVTWGALWAIKFSLIALVASIFLPLLDWLVFQLREEEKGPPAA